MKKKQFLSMILILSLGLAGCGSANKPAAPEESSVSAEASTQVQSSTAGESEKTDTNTSYEKADGNDLAEETIGELSHDGYTLEQVVLLSRHNIRSPLSGGDSLLGQVTDHEWFAWSSSPSELSVRGGILETEMGQFYRKWMEKEKLFPENYHPEKGEVRIYANSKQRTIATAQFFSAALLPTADVDVEYHADFDTMDPVFNPQLTFDSDKYSTASEKEIRDLYTDDIENLSDNYELISDVIDMEDTAAFKNGTVKALVTDDTELTLDKDAEPGMTGSLKNACSISDALVLQYYEESDDTKAGFGNNLDDTEWEDIAEVKDVYGDVLFSAPLVAANVAHPLLGEIRSELTRKGRLFTFLCGHDSNLSSVLAALDAEEYELPLAIEKKTPIGSKLMFSRYRSSDGKEYMSVDLVYQTVDQLRNMTILDLDRHPAVYPVSLKGISRNDDGLYQAADVMKKLKTAYDEYDSLQKKYVK